MKFLDFLTEAETKSKAIKHLTHLGGEAQFVNKAETNKDLTRLEDLHTHLSGGKSSVQSIGVKADGSPSFEMGHVINPDTGEKQFGVAYKGAAKGYAFTPAQVKEKFGHSPGLASKMGQLLEHGSRFERLQRAERAPGWRRRPVLLLRPPVSGGAEPHYCRRAG